jgi:hypothetical protein
MRRRAHRAHCTRHRAALAASSALVAVALAFVVPAKALEPSNEQQEIHDEQTLPDYAGTELPVDDYDPQQAAHPVRIVAYALHPVGVALDWIIVRPAYWVVQHEPFRTIFGAGDDND